MHACAAPRLHNMENQTGAVNSHEYSIIIAYLLHAGVCLCHTGCKQMHPAFLFMLSFPPCFEMLMQMSVELLSLNDFIVNLLSVGACKKAPDGSMLS